MQSSTKQKFLFIHIMKTGGTSFADIIQRNFARKERYPDAVLPPGAIMADSMEAYIHVPRVVATLNSTEHDIRMVSGHVPYAINELLHQRFTTLTLLRDPVSRTLSYLKHCRKYHVEHQGMELEAIYEDRWFYETFIHNYQTKLFAMSSQEVQAEERLGDMSPPLPPRSAFVAGDPVPKAAEPLLEKGSARLALELFSASTGVIEVNDNRLQDAKDNLSAMDLVGTTEHFDRFLQQLSDRFNWNTESLPHRNPGDDRDISKELYRRIAIDNQFDVALYEHALNLTS
ncbi:sulfotransferase family 2 domain-containing protein [Gymnodinialimonas sp.]